MSENKKLDNKITPQEEAQQIKGVLYKEEEMNQVLNILNSIPVNGVNNVKAMGMVFDILSTPIPFKSVEEEKQ